MMVPVRSRPQPFTLAVAAAVAITAALLVVFGGEGDGTGGEATADEITAAAPSVTMASPSESESGSVATTEPPAATTTTTTVVPATTSTTPTTTTVPPPTTTAAPPTTSSTGYVAIPKPEPGPNTVAPGGALTKHLAADIAAAFGLDVGRVEAAIAVVQLPPEAAGNPEGWLAPGTYEPAGATSAGEIVQAMVERRVAQLEERNIPREQWQRVVTAASVIEKETYNQNEKPKVARVLANRLAGGGKLQMDSIILYPVPEDRIFTTSEERASDQPYNSYRHNGLPPTPISSPDEASIDAFLDPPPGNWWFYVTIDLHSGETRYAVTFEEHEANVELLRAWQRDNPTP